MFIRVVYPDNRRVILSDEEASIHAQNLAAIFDTNSYGKLKFDIETTPVLMMPQPSDFYRLNDRLSLVRIRADAMKVAEEAGYREEDYDREIIFTFDPED